MGEDKCAREVVTVNTISPTIAIAITITTITTIDLIRESHLPRIQLDEFDGVEYLAHELDASIRVLDRETT